MPPPILIKERSKNLYGKTSTEALLGGTGDDYLRGNGGADSLTGGLGSDRFIFERTLAANGVDVIRDYTYNAIPAPRSLGPQPEMDVLDFSLVGFARGALASGDVSSVVRFMAVGSDAHVMISLNGRGSFQQWAVLENVQAGSTVAFQIGGRTYTQTVRSGELDYDIGNDDRRGTGEIERPADDDEWFDDGLTVAGRGAEVLIGDRVRGFDGVTPFEPGVTAIPIPQAFTAAQADDIGDTQFQVYYGTYDASTDIFTVTSTQNTTADLRTATHTMVLYDNDPMDGVERVEGFVLQGLYAKNQWSVDISGPSGTTLRYQSNYAFSADIQLSLVAENALYGSNADDTMLGDLGIDIIQGGVGNDVLFGGGRSPLVDGGPDDGADWLTGGAGNDAFFAVAEASGGIDAVTDFAVGDFLFLSVTKELVLGALDGNVPPQAWTVLGETAATLTDLGTLTGNTLQAALEAKNGVNGGIVLTPTSVPMVYVFDYGGKDYVFWDAFVDGYSPVPTGPTLDRDDDVVVEITGIANLAVSNIIIGGLPG
ncbi:MAG: hypothetical protein K2X78_10920 [Burkholderiaceae bacterium]|nr:hypothetical protein [Burkholderiaceae bacterium]